MINKHGSGRNTAFRHVGLLLEIVSVYHKLDEDFDHNDRYSFNTRLNIRFNIKFNT